MNQDPGIIRRIYSKLHDLVQISLADIQNILRELAASIDINENDEEEEAEEDGEERKQNEKESKEESNSSLKRKEQEQRKEQRKLLIEWSACLAVLESEYEE